MFFIFSNIFSIDTNFLIYLTISSPIIFICILYFLHDKNNIANFTINAILLQVLIQAYAFKNYYIESSLKGLDFFYRLINVSLFDYNFYFVVDSISLLLILLTSFLMLISLLVSLNINEFKITAIFFFFYGILYLYCMGCSRSFCFLFLF